MKKGIFFLMAFILFGVIPKSFAQTTLFYQDFVGASISDVANAAITNSDYYTTTGEANKFTLIQAGNHSTSYLNINQTTASNFQSKDAGSSFVWAVCRNANLAGTAPTVLKITFRAAFDVNSTGTTNPRFNFQVGNGFSNTFSTTNLAMKEADANVFAGFSLKSANSTNGATLFQNNGTTQIGATNIGEATNTWTIVINNSGSSINYTDPNSATESVADKTFDLWIGLTKWGNDLPAVTGTQSLQNFKFGSFTNTSGGRINELIDWFKIEDLGVSGPSPDIALANNISGQVATGNIIRNTTNNIIHNFQTAVTTANATLNAVSFSTTNSASDVTNYKLWYASTNSFGSAAQIGSSITTTTGTGSHSFSSLTQSITNGNTGYFWITADVPVGATPGNTIDVTGLTTSNLTFASGNKTGTTSSSGQQTIIAAPTVTTNAATSITTTDANLNGTVNANAATTSGNIQFQYGTTISYGTNVNASPSSASGIGNTTVAANSFSAGTLSTNTLYHFRVTATNAAGTSNGTDATLTTLSNAPTVGSGNGEYGAGFTANWTAPTNGGSESYTYTLEVDDDNAFGSVNQTYSSIASGTLSQVVSGLSNSTTYYFRVKAINAGGSSAWSAVSAGVTTTSPTAPIVTTTSVTAISGTTASSGGNVTSDGGNALSERGLVYSTSLNPTTADTKITDGAATTGTYSSSLTGLTPLTTYHVRAYAINGIGTGYGSDISFNTVSAEPTVQASGVTFSSVGTNSMTINFTSGDGSNRIVLLKAGSTSGSTPVDGTSYTANTIFGSGTLIGTGSYVVYNGTGNSVAVTGLTSGTIYYATVFEFNGSTGTENYLTTSPALGNQATVSQDFRSITSANWGNNSTWEMFDGASWIAADHTPTETDGIITIQSGNTVTVAASISADQIVVNAGGQITIAPSQTFTIANGSGTDLSVASTGYLKNQGTITLNSSATVSITGTYEHNVNGGSVPTATWNTGSTCLVTGVTSTMASGFSQTFYNLTYNCTGSSSLNMGMYNTTINGDFNFLNGGTSATETGLSNAAAGAGPNNTINILGNFNVNSSINTNQICAHRSGSANTVTALTINIYGNLNISSGAYYFVRNSGIASTTWNLYGNMNFTGGSFNTTGTTASFHFAKTGTQTFTKSGGTFSAGTIFIDAVSIVDAGTSAFDGAVPLTISSGATLTSAHASGSITTSGTKTLNAAANYVFNGSSAQTLSSSITGANNLTISNAAGVSLGAATAISGILTVTTGTLTTGANNLSLGGSASAQFNPGTTLNISGGITNFNSRPVTFKSDITGTARLGQVIGTLSGAANVTTERYLPLGKKAYRQLSSGVTTTNFISNNWQQGIQITGSTTGANGFDATSTGNPSMFTYSAGAPSFSSIANTNATILNAKTGYRVFVMGDRTAGNLTVNASPGIGQPNNNMSAATTITATGTLLTGATSFTSAASELSAVANDYALIANPYWSPVDWDALAKSNINTTYWIWDASIGNRGAYTSWTTGSGASGGGAITKDIQPGQAIFVQTTANGTAQIDFAEANKTSTFTNTFRPAGLSPSKLILNLIGAYGTNPVIVKDASTIAFRDDFSTAILGTEDAQKFTNSDENIAIMNATTALGLEARPTVANSDIIPVRLWKLFDNNTYSLKLNAQDFDAGIQAYLRDKKNNTQTAISMSGETTYPFTFTSSDSSSFYNRFEIVFNNTSPLPANFTNLKAYRKNNGIEVEWDIAAETAIKTYEVQRSEFADGFTTVATQTATANNGKAVNYNWFDANPFKTNNYYRIKVVGANGEVKYSSIVKVGNSKETEKVSVYPNPLEGNLVTLQLGGIADGKYDIQLFSSTGQQMMNSSITKQGAVQTQTLSLPKNMSAGVYRLSIRAEDGTIYNRNIIKL